MNKTIIYYTFFKKSDKIFFYLKKKYQICKTKEINTIYNNIMRNTNLHIRNCNDIQPSFSNFSPDFPGYIMHKFS